MFSALLCFPEITFPSGLLCVTRPHLFFTSSPCHVLKQYTLALTKLLEDVGNIRSFLQKSSNNDCLWKYKLYFFDNLKHLLITLKNSLSKSLLACNYALSHQKDSSHQQLFRNWEIRFSIAHPLKDPTHLTMLGWLALPSCLRREISRRTDMGTPSSVRASFT